MKVYVDLDGTLANFDAGHQRAFGRIPDKQKDDVDWEAVRSIPDFYLNLQPMVDTAQLWVFLKPWRPIILTGIPMAVPEAGRNKRAWVHKWLGSEVPVICCRSKEKWMHADPGDILIDDWEKHRVLWEKQGGRWITHTSAASSIEQFKAMIPL